MTKTGGTHMALKKNSRIMVILIVMIIAVISGILFYLWGGTPFRRDLRRFSQSSYDSVFLSMHSTAGYTQEDFADYHGLNTLLSSYEIQSMDELNHYLQNIFSSGNAVNHVFLLLDPELIWDACNQEKSKWNEELQNGLFSYVSAHPDVNFEIMLPYPSLNYWLDLEPTAMEDALSAYHTFIEDAYIYANIRTFFMGFENWMLINPDNYISEFVTNAEITKKIFLTCFCDGGNQITPVNEPILFNMLRELVARERYTPTVYPDLSDRCLVFFGDSVTAYGESSTTIAGYVTGFTDALTYNYSVGGSSASAGPTDTKDFPDMLSGFLEESCIEDNGAIQFSPQNADLSDKKLYFVLNYGLNDYFRGAAVENPEDPYDINTYTGGLRSCLQEYMTRFPDAEFIIMTPTFTEYFSYGADHNSDIGGSLIDYVDAAKALAEELDIYCIDNYRELKIDESNIWDFTADGCHPNEEGRIMIARQIIELLDDL